MTMRRMHRLACAASLLLALAPGCAEERDPINRVQADALAKEFFVGDLSTPDDDPQFYWRNFVVDGSEAQSMIGIGSWSAVDRIRWEITEKMLIARKSYPLSDGATPHGDGEGHPDGIVVAVYPIEKHFDIRRAYNSTTGEEMNVVEENSSDRAWSKREYMRVDWSMNLVDTPTWSDMFQGKLFGSITVSPIAYYVNDSGHPDRPHFEPEQGYFDVTSKFLVSPAEMESPFVDLDGTVPACVVMGLYTGSAVNSCDPQEAVVRSSFLRIDKVDPDQDFEPFENTQSSLDIIGNPGGLGSSMSSGVVTPPRVDWDPQYGYTDAGMHKYMHHHNIWAQSHQTTGVCESDDQCGGATCLPSGTCSVQCDYEVQDQVNGTNVQCTNDITGYEGNAGSQCSARGRCTIPVRDREIAPVSYWMSRDTPEALTDPLDADGKPTGRGDSEDLIYTWNQAMRFSVAKSREVECRNTGSGDRDSCHALYDDPPLSWTPQQARRCVRRVRWRSERHEGGDGHSPPSSRLRRFVSAGWETVPSARWPGTSA